METRYYNLSHSSSVSKSLLSSDVEAVSKGSVTQLRKRSWIVWLGTIWTLAAHCILSIGVAIFVLVYVANRHFNVTERTPPVQLIGGTQNTPFHPMQSDVVTFLSSIIAVLKYGLAAWATSLCWYIALFLMERRGLSRRNLKALVNYGFLPPNAYSGDWSTLVIVSLLLTNLIASLSSPIVTGSISWLPSNRLVHGLSNHHVDFGDVVDGTLARLLPVYYNNYFTREAYVMGAVGKIVTGWGRDTEKGAIKRVSDSVGSLAVNSTIQNATLPFFQVHSIHWIENRDEIPGIRDGNTTTDLLHEYFRTTPSDISGYPPGYAVLIPNTTSTNWSSDPLQSTTIHDTRLLLTYYAYDNNNEPSGVHSLVQDLPPNAYKPKWDNHYYAFAWVTFSAGVGECKEHNCVISSLSTIRNNTPIELEPHQLTFQALSMAPLVGVWLARQNTSLPYPWNGINDYVEQVLVRSYSGAWSSLDENMATSTTLAQYVPSLPSLLAVVDHWRVYIWLGIQLLITLLSILFLIIQSHISEYPLKGNTSLIAFDLDTTAVVRNSPLNRVRKVEERGNRLMLKAE